MKEYNKEKLHEYAKELFALCLDKGLIVRSDGEEHVISIYKRDYYGFENIGDSYLSESLYKSEYAMPIWELIEKVKQL